MTPEEYDTALYRLVGRYVDTNMTHETYLKHRKALYRKFEKSQKEKPSGNDTRRIHESR